MRPSPGCPAILPIAPPLTPADYAYGPAIFDDRAIPTSALITPSAHYDDFPYQPSWSDLLSPTSIVRDAVWRITSIAADVGLLDRPIDPLQEILPPFIGDWAGLLRCADVFDNLGAMLGMSQDCVDDADDLVSTIWTGQVAGMCVANLQFFATDFGDAIRPLAGISATYRQVSEGVRANMTLADNAGHGAQRRSRRWAVELATDGWFAAFDVGSDIRNVVKIVKRLLEIANIVADAVSAGSAAAGSFANKLGILGSAGSLPTLFEAGALATGQIPNLALTHR